MKRFTDRFFKFPIKVYDAFELKEAMNLEALTNKDEPEDIPFKIGMMSLPALDCHRMYWHDIFTRGHSRQEAKMRHNGFDLTLVVVFGKGDFVCTWNKTRFEQELNNFMEEYEEDVKKSSKAQRMNELAELIGEGRDISCAIDTGGNIVKVKFKENKDENDKGEYDSEIHHD